MLCVLLTKSADQWNAFTMWKKHVQSNRYTEMLNPLIKTCFFIKHLIYMFPQYVYKQ